jgi:hypothetical protein
MHEKCKILGRKVERKVDFGAVDIGGKIRVKISLKIV